MVAPGRFPYRQSRSGTLDQDEVEHVGVGDPDPTSRCGADHGHRMCQFEWADPLSRAFVLLWICTRERGHHGQHIAGTGEWVAAVCPV